MTFACDAEPAACMLSAVKLGKDVFIALAAVVWSDGELVEAEAKALLQAARAWGLAGEELAEVERAMREHVPLERVGELDLAGDARLLVYALATWLTQIDGVVVPTESETLAQLGVLLDLTEEDRALAATESVLSATMLAGATGHKDVLALAREIEARAEDAFAETVAINTKLLK